MIKIKEKLWKMTHFQQIMYLFYVIIIIKLYNFASEFPINLKF